MDIQKSIRLAMAHNGIKANELAARMGVSEPYVSNLINGKKFPTLQNVAAMAMITGFMPSEFIALGEEKTA